MRTFVLIVLSKRQEQAYIIFELVAESCWYRVLVVHILAENTFGFFVDLLLQHVNRAVTSVFTLLVLPSQTDTHKPEDRD